jgi:hypothetical protein
MSSRYSHLYPKPSGAKFALFQLTFIMIACSLIVDSINGFFLSGLGIDPRLSASYKLLILVFVLFQIGAHSVRMLAGLFTCILILLIGPIFSLADTLDVSAFINDFITVLKVTTAFIIFVYCVLMCRHWPDLLQKYGKWCCQLSFAVLSSNLILGVLGFGFSSYGNADSENSNQIGVKGFFYAGNEVSGLFILFFGTTLHLLWQRSKLGYFIFSPLVFIAGLLVATKSAMLSAAVLVLAIPLFNERNRLLNLTWLKVKMILPVVLIGVVLTLVLVPILEATGLWERFVWFYQNKGILGIIMSGRDVFVMNAMTAFQQFASLTEILFGFGRGGLGLITKDSMEIDPIDMYLWFGIAGGVLFLLLMTLFIRTSYLAATSKDSLWGPSVLVINFVLFGVSIIAGHILTSGMLGPFIGLLNGMAYADLCRSNSNDEITCTPVRDIL